MEDLRLQVNEDIIDTLCARIDDLDRRFNAFVDLLRRPAVCEALGLKSYDFDRLAPNDMTLKMRPMKYSNERHRAIQERQQKEVLARLSRLTPSRLDDLLRDR